MTRIGLAGASYELMASIPGVVDYFGPTRNETWRAISHHEERLQSILLGYLNRHEQVVIYGETSPDARLRVPVISFSVKGQSSREFVERVEACSDFGIRWGHFYSKKLVDDVLGLKSDGVIRVSLVHYNTGSYRPFLLLISVLNVCRSFSSLTAAIEEEVKRLIEVLENIIPKNSIS